MSRLVLWVVIVFLGYWSLYYDVSGVQKFGYIASATLFSLVSLFAIKWWCFLKIKTKRKSVFFENHIVSTSSSVLMSLIIMYGFDYWNYGMIFLAVLSGIIFLPDGNLKWFWRHRWGDLQEMSDSGIVRDHEYLRIRNLAFGFIFTPVPMFYLVGLIWGR